MKINRQQKLLYIHIPKCGGTSVWQAFGMEGLPEVSHIGIESVEKEFPIMTRDYLKFTTIRNPWEAEVSNFFYKLSAANVQARGGREHVVAALNGFSGMLKEQAGISCFSPNKVRTHKYGRSMMRFITDGDDNIIVDEILRLENIQNDVKKMCEKHKLKPVKKIGQMNKTHHLHYSRYYTEPWMIDYVRKKNEDYIEKFDYDFEQQFY
jgi:hypothetical protein